MLRKLQHAVNLFKSLDQDELTDQSIVNLLQSGLDYDQNSVAEFFQTTPFEFIEDYDLVKGGKHKDAAPVGTTRGNFVKGPDGWKYKKKEPGEKKLSGTKKTATWKNMNDKTRKEKIDAAHARLKIAEAGTEEKHKTEALALRLWIGQHQQDSEKSEWVKEDMEKGGAGSGSKGHHTDRKPFPGEEQHKFISQAPRAPSGMKGPRDVGVAHYSDSPMLQKYRTLIKKLGHEAVEGRFHYDPRNDKIVATDEGKMLAEAAAGMHRG